MIMQKILVIAVSLGAFLAPSPVNSQLIPQPWVSVGVKDNDPTFALGARAINWELS